MIQPARTFLLLAIFMFCYRPGIAQSPGAEYSEHELIVQISAHVDFTFKPQSLVLGIPLVDALNERHGIRSIDRLVKSRPAGDRKARPDTDRILVFTFSEGVDIPGLIETYQATGLFDYAEPNYIGYGAGKMAVSPNDSWYSRQWSHHNDGTFNASATIDADIDMNAAWDITTGSNSIIAAVLDSGTKLDHPEFSGRLWTNTGDNNSNGTDDDANGYTDDFQGWDFVNDDNDPTDDHGHGTNVIGLLGATGNNGIGYAGVDWNCQLMTCKILNSSNSGFYSWWTAAIYYAVDQGADVINMSVGGTSFSSSMQTAVNYAHANGVFIAVSMMNTDNNTPYYPAAYANTIAVGATDTNDERADPFFWSASSGSNYGNHIDISAPGNHMFGLSYTSNTNYNSKWGGTSQAAPLVTGVAALIKALDPTLSVDSIRTILQNTADDQVGRPAEDTPGWDQYHGAGRMNAQAALEFVNSTLPVELLAFEARLRGRAVALSWQTAHELNNRGFEVLRSTNRHMWETREFVPGKGNSEQMQFYSWVDQQPNDGIQYYRLRQIDMDGNHTYSNILKVKVLHLLPEVYPNPFEDRIYVKHAGGQLRIYDLTGLLVHQSLIEESSGEIITRNLSPGMYIVEILNEKGHRFVERLIRK